MSDRIDGRDIHARKGHGDPNHIVAEVTCPLCKQSVFIDVPRLAPAGTDRVWVKTCSRGAHGTVQQSFQAYARKLEGRVGFSSLEIWGEILDLSPSEEE